MRLQRLLPIFTQQSRKFLIMQNNTAPYTGVERRKYKRISYWTLARFKEAKSESEFKQGYVNNISEGGLLLKTKKQIFLNSQLDIELYIPYVKGFHLIKVKAKPVCHKQTKENFWLTNMEFQYINAESKSLLSEFIRFFEDKALYPYRYISQESYLHIPYWCIVQQNEIQKEQFSETTQNENFYHAIFESKINFSPKTQIELELKIPTIKMPFKVRGMILESVEIKKKLEYSILLKLINLSKYHLDLIKKFVNE